MKKLIALIIAVVLLASLAVPVLAVSDTSTAQYRATIIVSNNSTATSGVATILSANTSAWQDVDYINSSCNNTAMLSSGSDVEYMPGYGGNPWAIWVSDIGTFSYQTNLLYMDGTADMHGYIRYFPANGGMTTSDNASIEFSDNFTYSAKGWLDTDAGADKYIYFKEGTLSVYVSPSDSENITASAYGAASSDDIRVAASADDAVQCRGLDPSYSLTAEITAGAGGVNYLKNGSGMCFLNIEVPQSSTVTTAYITFTANANLAGDTVKTYISAYDSDNATTFGNQADFEGKFTAHTTAKVDWQFTTDWVTDSTYNSPEIKTVIQEVLDRPGWSIGNSMALFWEDFDNRSTVDAKRTAYSYNGDPTKAPLLHIETSDGSTIEIYATGISSGEKTVNVAKKLPFFGIGVDNTTALLPTVGNLVVNAPLPQAECSTDPFTTIDSNAYSFNPSGATWSSSGYSFDGNDLIDGGDQTLLRPGSQSMTFIAWINPTNFADDRALFSKGDVTGNAAGSYHIYFPSEDLRVYYQSSTAKNFNTNTPIGSYTQIIVVCNHATDSITVYQNGVQVGVPSSDAWQTGNTRTDQFFIGANDLGGTTDYFIGVIGEVRVYNKAFSLAEVQQDYNATAWRYTGDTSRMVYSTLANIPDNDKDIVSFQNGVMPYVEYQRIYIDGVLQQQIEWEYGATFHNSAHGGDDATPTFRTTSSDADVTAELTAFAPMTVARAPAFAVSEAPLFYTAPITTAGNFTATTIPAGGPPGSAVIEDAAAAGGTPSIWIWGILAICLLAAIGLFISWMERKYGSGGGSLMLRVIVGVVVFGMLIAWGKFDFWMLVLYLMVEAALLMMSRQGEIGGNVSQYGLIGFLAQSWMGLTIINRIMEKQFITGNEQLWANYFAFTQEFKLLGLFNIPVINFQFFTYGLPSLLNWGEYSFFGGNAQMFEYLLYTLTAVVSFIMFGMVIGLLYNAIRVR